MILGDIIPENTLILICDRFDLNLKELLNNQKDENIKENEKFYNDIILKYDDTFPIPDFIDNDNDIFYDLEKEFLKENSQEMGEKLVSLYSIFYNNFYDDLSKEVFQRWDIKSKRYDFTSDLKNEKIIIKEICTFESGESEEKILDIFKLNNIDSMLKSLEEFFNIKIVAMRKLKKRQDKFEDSLTVKKNNLK